MGNGPALSKHGVADYLADPVMEVYAADGSLIHRNDNWADDTLSAEELRGFDIAPAYAEEPALHLTLDAGYYTFIVKGAGADTGEAVINIYQRGDGHRFGHRRSRL